MTNPSTTPATGDGAGSEALGLWHDPDAEYVAGLGQTGSITLLAGLMLTFAALIPTEGRITRVATIALIVAAVVAPFALRDRWHRNLYQRGLDEIRWHYHRYTGRSYHAAPWHLPTTNHHHHDHNDHDDHDDHDDHHDHDGGGAGRGGLPGLLGALVVAEHYHTPDHDTDAGPDAGHSWDAFAVVRHTRAHTLSAVIACSPDGTGLADTDTTANHQMAWERFLAAMSDEPGIAGVQVVTEAAPTLTGPADAHLRQLIAERHSPTYATTVLGEVVEAATGRTGTRTWVTITWDPGSAKAADGLGSAELAARLARICELLTEAGAGTTQPLTRHDLAVVWAGMYNPDDRERLNQLQPGDHVAPTTDNEMHTSKEERTRYCITPHHDTVSLTMGIAPDSIVTPAIFDRLATGIPGTTTVRTALLLRPIPAMDARDWARTMRRAVDTRHAFAGERRLTAAEIVADEDATATSTALARGSTNLTHTALAITLTVPADTDLAGPIERTRAAAAPLTPRLRRMNTAHQTTWVATLPGTPPIPHTTGLTR